MDELNISNVAYSIPLTIGAFLSLVVAAEAFRRRGIPGSLALGLAMVLSALWNLTAIFERADLLLEQRLFWTRLSYLAIPWISPLWLLFVSKYLGRDRWVSRQSLLTLFAIPLVTMLLGLTWEYHDLIYTHTGLIMKDGRHMLQLEYGRWFWIFFAFSGAVIAAGIWICLESWLTSPGLLRKPPRLLTLVGVIPLVVNLIYVFRVDPLPAHDYTPFALSLSGALSLWGLRRFSLLEIVPMARDKVFESMPDPVLVVDARRRIVETNPAFSALLPKGSIVSGMDLCALPEPWGGLLGPLEPGIHDLCVNLEGREPLYFQSRVTLVSPAIGTSGGLLVLLRDTTAEKLYSRELMTRAMHDSLTGLPNRAMFDEFLHGELERSKRLGTRLAVLFLDMDGFKKVNDTHGHAVGDRLLQHVGELLRVAVRGSDRVARFGGDEFLVLLPDIAEEATAKAVAQRIIAALEGVTTLDGKPMAVSASVGLAVAPDDASETTGLVQKADQAMYAAKAAGGRQVLHLGTPH